MDLKNITMIVLSSFLAISCSSLPMATSQLDKEAKQFKKPSGPANLYIYRKGLYGAAVSFPALINDRKIGNLKTNTFQKLSLPAGYYTLSTHDNFNTYKPKKIYLAKNQTTYVEAKLRAGLIKNKVEFKPQSAEEAQPYITNSKLTAHIQDPLSQPTETKKHQLIMAARRKHSQKRDNSQLFKGMIALAGGAYLANQGVDAAGVSAFARDVINGSTANTLAYGQQAQHAASAQSSSSRTSAVSANEPNLIDKFKLRKAGGHGKYYIQMADVYYQEYKKSGKPEAYAIHKQTVDNLRSIIKK